MSVFGSACVLMSSVLLLVACFPAWVCRRSVADPGIERILIDLLFGGFCSFFGYKGFLATAFLIDVAGL